MNHSNNLPQLRPAKRKRFYWLVGILSVLFVGILTANYFVKKKGYNNLLDFLTTTGGNYKKSWNAHYETIQLYINEDDFGKMEAQRDRALERGVMVNEDDSYVDAVLLCGKEKANAQVRLKGHMTDHLQDRKWSFRVKTEKNDAILGMKRFSLQHPGTRNYVYEWIYHKMMEHENIISLRYNFVKLIVNDEDWGIYAVEEHFGQELVQHNHRLKGPVFRFNPELYWVYRLNEMNKVSINEEYAQMQSAYVEAYDTKNTLKDKDLRILFENAMQRMEAFRRGELRTSEVFDIERLAKFHAIIDIVGGHHSLDWSDVKYYYNSETQLLEPVAYESFSIRPVRTIAGSYRFTGKKEYIDDLHDALFNDPEFFTAYIRAIEYIAKKEWLDKLLEEIDPELQSHLEVLYKEFPYKNYDPKDYYANIKSIEKITDAPRSFNAHFEKYENDSLYLAIGGLDALPAEITAVLIESDTVNIQPSVFVPCKLAKQNINYYTFRFAVPQGKLIDEKSKLKLIYHLPGSATYREQKVFSYPAYNSMTLHQTYMLQKPNVQDFDFLVIDETTKIIHTKPGIHVIEKDLILPKSYTWNMLGGTEIQLNKNARIISHAALRWDGVEEDEIIITSGDKSGQGVILSEPEAASVLNHVVFRNLTHPEEGNFKHKAALNVYKANIRLGDVVFENIKGSAMQLVSANAFVQNMIITEVKKDGIRAFFSNLEMSNVTITKADDDGILLNGSVLRGGGIQLKKIRNNAFTAKEFSSVSLGKLAIEKSVIALLVEDASDVMLNELLLEECETGIKLRQHGGLFGPASAIVKKLQQRQVRQLRDEEEGNTVTIETGE